MTIPASPEAYESEVVRRLRERLVNQPLAAADVQLVVLDGSPPDSELLIFFALAQQPNATLAYRFPLWRDADPQEWSPSEWASVIAANFDELVDGHLARQRPMNADPLRLTWVP